jgi:hypothetical protein
MPALVSSMSMPSYDCRESILVLFIFPSHKTNKLKKFIFYWKTIENPVPCMNSRCEVQSLARTDMCSGWLPDLPSPLSHTWCMVRTAPSPLPFCGHGWPTVLKQSSEQQFLSTLNRCCMDLWQSVGSYLSSSSTATSPFPQLPTRKSKHAFILGCRSISFRLSPLPWLPRVVSQLTFEHPWPPGNWSSLLSDYHENHLLWVD